MKLGRQRKSRKGLVGAFNQEKAQVLDGPMDHLQHLFPTEGVRRGCPVCAAGELPQRVHPRGALPGLDTV